jgi:hypothetical protein
LAAFGSPRPPPAAGGSLRLPSRAGARRPELATAIDRAKKFVGLWRWLIYEFN